MTGSVGLLIDACAVLSVAGRCTFHARRRWTSDKTALWTFTGVCFVFGLSILIDHQNGQTGTGTDSGNPTV